MAKILDGVSRTFGEFLLIPRLTRKNQSSESINLSASMGESSKEGDSRFDLNILKAIDSNLKEKIRQIKVLKKKLNWDDFSKQLLDFIK